MHCAAERAAAAAGLISVTLAVKGYGHAIRSWSRNKYIYTDLQILRDGDTLRLRQVFIGTSAPRTKPRASIFLYASLSLSVLCCALSLIVTFTVSYCNVPNYTNCLCLYAVPWGTLNERCTLSPNVAEQRIVVSVILFLSPSLPLVRAHFVLSTLLSWNS